MITFSLRNKLIAESQIDEIARQVDEQVAVSLADYYGLEPDDMVLRCVDAALAFISASIAINDRDGTLAPSLVANTGWRALAGPQLAEDGEVYSTLCHRLSRFWHTPLFVPQYVPYSTLRWRLAITDTVPKAVVAMQAHDIPFVPVHWQLSYPELKPDVKEVIAGLRRCRA